MKIYVVEQLDGAKDSPEWYGKEFAHVEEFDSKDKASAYIYEAMSRLMSGKWDRITITGKETERG